MFLRLFISLILLFSTFNAHALKKCTWNNNEGTPCITVSKTPNSSIFNKEGINKITITKEDIIKSGAVDTNDVLKLIPGLDIFQSGTKGQQTSLFTRGSESNHTLDLFKGKNSLPQIQRGTNR